MVEQGDEVMDGDNGYNAHFSPIQYIHEGTAIEWFDMINVNLDNTRRVVLINNQCLQSPGGQYSSDSSGHGDGGHSFRLWWWLKPSFLAK